ALLPLVALVVLVSLGAGDEPKPDDKQVVDSKAEKRQPATAINFRKELNLPFNSLSTLGARIEGARRNPDPIALGNAAHELAVAEKVSGKTASLTSKALLKEAAQLAMLRREATELKATLEMTNQIATEETDITDMKAMLGRAQQQIKDETAAIRQNTEP